MADDWQDHVVRTYPDGSKMCWSGGSGHWPCEVSDLRARLAAVERACIEHGAYGQIEVERVLAAARGEGDRPAAVVRDPRGPDPDIRRRICLYCGRDDCDHLGRPRL